MLLFPFIVSFAIHNVDAPTRVSIAFFARNGRRFRELIRARGIEIENVSDR